MPSIIFGMLMMMIIHQSSVNGECTLDCGDDGGVCLKTQILSIPEICACPDGSFTNSSCLQLANETKNENNDNNSTTLNIHSRRLIAVCEHSFCGSVGICIIIDATFACICPDGTIASTCLDETGVQPIVPYCNGCLNDGVCNTITGTCVCPSGFIGTRCEIASATNLCRDVTCRNGGVCNILSPTYAACWCLLGFHGDFCERRSAAPRCSSLQCFNGGTCYEHSPATTVFAYCLCKPGFTGTRCEHEYFRCPINGRFADAYGCAQGKYFECVEKTIIISRNCPRGLRYNFFLNRCDYTASVACPAL